MTLGPSLVRSSLLCFVVLSVVLFAGLARAFQRPFGDTSPVQKDEAAHKGSFQSSAPGFAIFSPPQYPGYSLRFRSASFCDPTVNVYTGYLDVDQGSKHIFFYFFESRRDPYNDDIITWIEGGPGGSTAIGMMMVMGPCKIDVSNSSTNGTLWNPHGWNKEANLLFLDQPVGTGFSFSDIGNTVETSEDAAKDIVAFFNVFFETFSKFKGAGLHLAGESYAGHFVPIFASEISDQNMEARNEGREEINLKSMIIGNGITDIMTEYPGRFEVLCGKGALSAPPKSTSECVRMRAALPRCQQRMLHSCRETFDAIDCLAAVKFCESQMPFLPDNNPYDISRICTNMEARLGGLWCYAEPEAIDAYLNLESTRAILGTTEDTFPFQNYSIISIPVNTLFNNRLDKWFPPVELHVGELLERGVKALIFTGVYDSVCPWPMNRDWVEQLAWSGGHAFRNSAWMTWEVDDKQAGELKSSGPLTLASVWGAGHMAAHDKPAEVFFLISRWINNIGLQF
ncbi:peptidase S10 serine carboxypeptidase [Schizopora paradoxa]|uniref:Carboxypeptidase n=1 Tax=Schizopora paradoxa TaxID=27342 RepID=A0A0H2RVX8_9AGAM|nr:peptidase S10 serine carboxypeptidase [Schizopora paradoxa]